MHRRLFVLTMVFLGAFPGCKWAADQPTDLGLGPCHDNGTCDKGLVCLSGACRELSDPLAAPDWTRDPNGAWLDPGTGLSWQNPSPDTSASWSGAMQYCASLTRGGGGWRLPTVGELRTLIRGCDATVEGGACDVSDACTAKSCWKQSICSSCALSVGPGGDCHWPAGLAGPCSGYWASSPSTDAVDRAWSVFFNVGNIIDGSIRHSRHIRCVR